LVVNFGITKFVIEYFATGNSLYLAFRNQFCGEKWDKRPDVLHIFYRPD
jgi:hypothetical protein